MHFFCFWLGQIPLAYVLARPLGLGPTGAYIAVTLSFSALAIWGAVLFRRGKWREKRI